MTLSGLRATYGTTYGTRDLGIDMRTKDTMGNVSLEKVGDTYAGIFVEASLGCFDICFIKALKI